MNHDLFATGGIKDPSPSAPKQISPSHVERHVLPKDLPNAIKHLSDEELDRLLVVTLAEAKRRGRHTVPTRKRPADGLQTKLLMKETPPFRGISSATRFRIVPRLVEYFRKAEVRILPPQPASQSLTHARRTDKPKHREQFLKLAYEWAQAAELRASLQSKPQRTLREKTPPERG